MITCTFAAGWVKCSSQALGVNTRGKRRMLRTAVVLTAAASVSPAAQRAARAGATRWCLVLRVKSSSIKPETLLEEHGGGKKTNRSSAKFLPN